MPKETVSMWCNECEVWTSEYNLSGVHHCGTEVDAAGIGEKPQELNYQGQAKD